MSVFSILSEEHSTRSTIQSLYLFLSDFKNFAAILPEDKVENFQFTADECSFNIKGITPMKIKLIEKKENEFLLFSSEGLARFNFSLKAVFKGVAQSPGNCKIEMGGDLNPFILKMAEKQLNALVNTMSLRLSQLEL